MKFKFLFVVFFTLSVIGFSQESSMLGRKLIIDSNIKTVDDCFNVIKKSGIVLSYNSVELNVNKSVNIMPAEYSVKDLLELCVGNEEFDVRVLSGQNKILLIKKEVKYTLCGYIKEFESLESLIGAAVFTKNGAAVAASNSYGFYSIVLPKGESVVYINYLGYEHKAIAVNLQQNTRLDVLLKPISSQLNSVVVTSSSDDNSSKKVNISDLDDMPALLGTKDFLKQLQFITGTGGGAAYSSRLQVRGGKADNNLVLLDDVPLYNYSHITGLLSVFNSDALKYANFYKGRFPARYSGRISSVADIRMRDGDMNSYHAGVSIDLLTLSGFFEGPIKKEKASFIVSARRSWFDWFTRLFGKKNKFDCAFDDINLKLNYIAGSKDHLYFSAYTGSDHYVNDNIFGNQALSWGSAFASARWNHIFNNRLFMSTTAYVSRFANKLVDNTLDDEFFLYNTKFNYSLKEYNISSFIDFFNENYIFKGGIRLTGNNYKNATKRFYEVDNVNYNINAFKTTVFTENNIRLASNLRMEIGLNYSLHISQNSYYNLFDPRMQLNYMPNSRTNLYVGFSKMSQFFHQITSLGLSLPYELRIPSSKSIKPENSQLYETGVNYKSKNEVHSLSASIFYNRQKNILEYRAGQDLYNNIIAPDTKNQIIKGSGKGKGIEATYSSNYKKLSVNMSAAFYDIKECFDSLNDGEYFPSGDYSKVVLQNYTCYKFNERKHLSATIIYTSGKYVSVPSYIVNVPYFADNENVPPICFNQYYFDRMNNYKLKGNIQISVGYTYKKFYSKKREGILQFGIYNLIGRGSPYYTSVETSYANNVRISNTYMPNFAPYISYSYRF